MKNLFLLLMLFPIAKQAPAQYKAVDQGSAVKFTIRNFGFDVTGSFTGVQGHIDFDPQNPTDIGFNVSIDAATVNTDNSLRDQHLKDDGYFDVINYPRIRLASTKIIASNKGGTYLFSGQLTIKGKSKGISFPFTAISSGDGFVFKGSFKINRKDFGIGGTSTISNELEVSLNVLAKK
jgi:polyisoprenoid-binding protein YceI